MFLSSLSISKSIQLLRYATVGCFLVFSIFQKTIAEEATTARVGDVRQHLPVADVRYPTVQEVDPSKVRMHTSGAHMLETHTRDHCPERPPGQSIRRRMRATHFAPFFAACSRSPEVPETWFFEFCLTPAVLTWDPSKEHMHTSGAHMLETHTRDHLPERPPGQ